MYYRMYLDSLCDRRHWPSPQYASRPDRRGGYTCQVTVNNRQYWTEVPYATEDLARDGAAMKAFMICRNFSANDGRYPGQRPGHVQANGVAQGQLVPIGSGRRRKPSDSSSESSEEGNSSGSSSPKIHENGYDEDIPRVTPQMPKPSRRSHARHIPYMCPCHRGAVRAYGYCDHCLGENGFRV